MIDDPFGKNKKSNINDWPFTKSFFDYVVILLLKISNSLVLMLEIKLRLHIIRKAGLMQQF
jgi:hypothetical protein